MKEELDFQGSQLTIVNTVYSVGYLMYVYNLGGLSR